MATISFSKSLSSSHQFLPFSLISFKKKKFPSQIQCARSDRYEARIQAELETFLRKYQKAENGVTVYENWKKHKNANFEDGRKAEDIFSMRKGEVLKYLREKYFPMEEEEKEWGNRRKTNVKKPKKEKDSDGEEEDSKANVKTGTETEDGDVDVCGEEKKEEEKKTNLKKPKKEKSTEKEGDGEEEDSLANVETGTETEDGDADVCGEDGDGGMGSPSYLSGE